MTNKSNSSKLSREPFRVIGRDVQAEAVALGDLVITLCCSLSLVIGF